ncbi:hypothetical protein AB1Y20_011489 [Prymnesium parvum]|uniref:Cyclic nucleotide-binding domain-containing protein n=1 Tax=Prymnesium parvum TaxID=97485 RepID=A0AB34IGL1_PRYPA
MRSWAPQERSRINPEDNGTLKRKGGSDGAMCASEGAPSTSADVSGLLALSLRQIDALKDGQESLSSKLDVVSSRLDDIFERLYLLSCESSFRGAQEEPSTTRLRKGSTAEFNPITYGCSRTPRSQPCSMSYLDKVTDPSAEAPGGMESFSDGRRNSCCRTRLGSYLSPDMMEAAQASVRPVDGEPLEISRAISAGVRHVAAPPVSRAASAAAALGGERQATATAPEEPASEPEVPPGGGEGGEEPEAEAACHEVGSPVPSPRNAALVMVHQSQQESRRGRLGTPVKSKTMTNLLTGSSSDSVDDVLRKCSDAVDADGAEAPCSRKTALSYEPEQMSREDRLRLFLTQDQDVEALLTAMRKSEQETDMLLRRQATWELHNPVASRLVLMPRSKAQSNWDLFMLVLVVCSAVMMPLDVAFKLSELSFFLEFLLYFIDSCFMLDLLLGFRTAFQLEGVIIKLPSTMARHYLKGWFLLDFAAAFPLNIIVESTPLRQNNVVDVCKLVRIIRLCKLPRILGANPAFNRWRAKVSTSVFQLVLGMVFLVFIFHLMGCLYTLIVRYEVGQMVARAGGRAVEGSYCTNYEMGVVESLGTWLPPCEFIGLMGNTVVLGGDIYLFSFLWTMCAMSGTQVATPTTSLEVVFTQIVILTGFLVTAYVIGTFTSSLTQLAAAGNFERQKRDYIEQYLQYKGIPPALRRQVQQFYQFAGFEEGEQMLETLPVSLRLKLDLVLSKNIFIKVPFFKNCDLSQISVIVPLVHHEFAGPGKTVLHEGVTCTGLYMIGRGFAKVIAAGQIRKLLSSSDFFGETSLLSDVPATVTVQTITLCQFEVIAKKEFHHVLTLYPQVRRMLVRFAAQREKKDKQPYELSDVMKQLGKVTLDLKQANYFTPETKLELKQAMSDLVEQTRMKSTKADRAGARRSSWLAQRLFSSSNKPLNAMKRLRLHRSSSLIVQANRARATSGPVTQVHSQAGKVHNSAWHLDEQSLSAGSFARFLKQAASRCRFPRRSGFRNWARQGKDRTELVAAHREDNLKRERNTSRNKGCDCTAEQI